MSESERPNGAPLAAGWAQGAQHIERRTLGFKPYVLVESRTSHESLLEGHDVRMFVEYGGGITEWEDAAGMLAVTLSRIPGGVEYMRKVIGEIDG